MLWKKIEGANQSVLWHGDASMPLPLPSEYMHNNSHEKLEPSQDNALDSNQTEHAVIVNHSVMHLWQANKLTAQYKEGSRSVTFPLESEYNCFILHAMVPLSCFSRDVMTLTASCRMVNLVRDWALPVCNVIMWPSSLIASFMSRTRSLRVYTELFWNSAQLFRNAHPNDLLNRQTSS